MGIQEEGLESLPVDRPYSIPEALFYVYVRGEIDSVNSCAKRFGWSWRKTESFIEWHQELEKKKAELLTNFCKGNEKAIAAPEAERTPEGAELLLNFCETNNKEKKEKTVCFDLFFGDKARKIDIEEGFAARSVFNYLVSTIINGDPHDGRHLALSLTDEEISSYRTTSLFGSKVKAFFIYKDSVLFYGLEKISPETLKTLRALEFKEKAVILFDVEGTPYKIEDITVYPVKQLLNIVKNQTKDVIEYFKQKWAERIGSKLFFTGDSYIKHMSVVKRLIESHGIKTVKDLIDVFFTSKNRFYEESGYPLNMFYAQAVLINLIAELSARNKQMTIDMRDAIPYRGYYWRKSDCMFYSGSGYAPIDSYLQYPEKYAIKKIEEEV